MIIVKNISQNDVFYYSLVQINGKIKPFCFCNQIEVLNLTSDIRTVWPLTIFGYFKVFCELNIGENIVKLSCLHNSIEICLKYLQEHFYNSVEILLITCSDTKSSFFHNTNLSIETYINRILLSIKLVQCFIAESLFKNGFQKRTFNLKQGVDIFKSKLTTDECLSKNEKELWHYFAKEITQMKSEKVVNTKWIAFMSFTEYKVNENKVPTCHEDVIKLTKGYSALGSNGLALLGTGNIYCFPENLNQLSTSLINCCKVDRALLMDDSAFRGFYWSNFSTALGTILHELCHCFGMGHSNIGIMNRGGDDINIVLSFSVGDKDCQLCLPKLRKKSSLERRDLYNLEKEKKFVYSRCKSLGHVGQCFWTDNNIIMLNYHKWLTQSPANIVHTKSAFRIYNNQVESVNGFLLIEIRTVYPENLCVGSCKFLSEKIYNQKFSARKISQLIKIKSALRMNFKFSLVLMDIIGNIVSVDFTVNMNILSFRFCDNSLKIID